MRRIRTSDTQIYYIFMEMMMMVMADKEFIFLIAWCSHLQCCLQLSFVVEQQTAGGNVHGVPFFLSRINEMCQYKTVVNYLNKISLYNKRITSIKEHEQEVRRVASHVAYSESPFMEARLVVQPIVTVYSYKLSCYASCLAS